MRGRMCTVDAKYGLLAKYEFIAKYRFIRKVWIISKGRMDLLKVWIISKVWIYLYGHRNTIQTTLPSGKKG